MSYSSHSSKPPIPVFIATTIVIFFLTLSAADSIGFVPNYVEEPGTSSASDSTTSDPTDSSSSLALNELPMLGAIAAPQGPMALPTSIRIPAIGLDLEVQNPSTRNIDALDELLKSGPARYVGSASLGTEGNMIIFAHSSHLPIVHNRMYKAFNRIPELKAGDSITLEGDDGKSYEYSVIEVHKADATEDKIDLTGDHATLTLVTCDTLTSKSSRFVLTADFVGIVSL